MRVLAVDPGLRGCGVALFDLGGTLWTAAYVKNPAGGSGPLAWRGMSDAVSLWLGEETPYEIRGVFELPQVYREAHRTEKKADPNDLIQLAGVLGALSMLFAESDTTRPHDWKGSVPKKTMTDRIWDRVTPVERTRVKSAGSLTHNVIDAIGIGLHSFGRLTPKRVIAR